MSVEIKEVDTSSRKEIRRFVLFPEKLYKNNPYYVPCLVFDEIDTLDPRKNPAFGFCESRLYMAYKDGEPVGRIAAIVNNRANEQWGHKEVRFGWFDTIDDREVSAALIAKAEEFGRERGMDHIVGPLGYTDFDPEGMLVEGFDHQSTMPLIYNFPYYVEHIEALGFTKDADWLEYRLTIPETVPEKYARVAKIVEKRNNFHVRPVTRRMVNKEHYAQKIFSLITECYKDLYEYTVMPDDLADRYIGFYLKVLDLRYVTIVENDKDEIIAFGITMPSLADALQKSRGRLFPLGWWHLLKALFIKHSEGAELLLMGARPDVRNSGVTAMVIADMFSKYHEMGVKWAETNAELEDNFGIRNSFEPFERIQHKRRRSYKKAL